MDRFNALNRTNSARKAGGDELQVVAFKSSSKELTLTLRAVVTATQRFADWIASHVRLVPARRERSRSLTNNQLVD